MIIHSPNVLVWCEELETTTESQAKSALVAVDDAGEIVGFCCLGLGSVKCAGLEIVVSEPEDDFDTSIAQAFVNGYHDLAPERFVMWLFDLGSSDDITIPNGNSGDGWDLPLDYPYTVGGGEGVTGQMVTAASLNDTGCTFAQIAQAVRYFGIKGDPARSAS